VLKEVVFSYEEFKQKVDSSKPLHHQCWHKPRDEHGVWHDLVFRIFGISRNGNHILVWEYRERVDTFKAMEKFHGKNAYEDLNKYLMLRYDELVERYAKPLNSTEGAWME
jgi:hypothetical protein